MVLRPTRRERQVAVTPIYCAFVVPHAQARLAQALWSELGLNAQDALAGHVAGEPCEAEAFFHGEVWPDFAHALDCPHTLARLARERGMDFDDEQFHALCAQLRRLPPHALP